MKELTTELGCRYYPELPENTRLGKIGDFVAYGRKKIGMEYLTYGHVDGVYSVNVVREGTTGKKIQDFIDAGMLYVFTNKN